MAPTPNSALLAAHLREDTADLLALLPRPAVRRRAAPAAAKPRWTASPARPTARCAPPKTWPLTPRSAPHRPTRSRCALQRWPRPTSAARRVCAGSAVFVPEWPRAPLWAMGRCAAVCRRTG